MKNGWLSPRGKLVTSHDDFDTRMSFHLDLGACILKDLNGWSSKYQAYNQHGATDYVYRELAKRGYIRLHGFADLTPVWVLEPWQKLTKRQETYILGWACKNNRRYEDCFSK